MTAPTNIYFAECHASAAFGAARHAGVTLEAEAMRSCAK
ncbi:hypothetical protein MSIMFB_03794 [Mycobacterium simulans]|uniref:Uncharacterized protein n=1 Tax=Mycobacterium simulans TaxID=627089 RepID=A0A7Z7IN93_9MYCO|nr:hypothetical protein MSIMFB_03794 [Mycobacterium simulans]